MNQGKPDVLCVGPGANGFVDSRVQGDDALTAGGITTGPDGICNTLANHYDLPPANCPSAAELAAYLNDVWGKQANVWFNVTRSDYTVNYDLDRSGSLAYPDTQNPATLAESQSISLATQNLSSDYNIYYVRGVDADSIGTPVIGVSIHAFGETWTSADDVNSQLNHTAHEVGHLLGRNGHSEDVSDIIYHTGQAMNPQRVIKNDWDKVNP